MRSYKKAEPLYRRSLDIREKAFGPNSPAVALGLRNMAVLLGKTGREKEAIARHAIKMIEAGPAGEGEPDGGAFRMPANESGAGATQSRPRKRPDLDGAYGYAEHGELSLLFRRSDQPRSAHDLLCRVVSAASAKLSLLLGQVATFEGRLYQFASTEAACDYFVWRRQEQAIRLCHPSEGKTDSAHDGADRRSAVPPVLCPGFKGQRPDRRGAFALS